MTNTELNRLMKSYAEYSNMMNEIKSCMEDIKSEIITELEERKVTGYTGTEHTVKYCTIESNRIDTKTVKNKYPDVARECTVKNITHRFTFK